MFSVGLFYISLGLLLGLFGFRWIENQELGSGARYFSRARAYIDTRVNIGKLFLKKNFSMTAIRVHVVWFGTLLQHYSARIVAQLGHMLEHRARRVVHRTAKRARTDHYLTVDVLQTVREKEEKEVNKATNILHSLGSNSHEDFSHKQRDTRK